MVLYLDRDIHKQLNMLTEKHDQETYLRNVTELLKDKKGK